MDSTWAGNTDAATALRYEPLARAWHPGGRRKDQLNGCGVSSWDQAWGQNPHSPGPLSGRRQWEPVYWETGGPVHTGTGAHAGHARPVLTPTRLSEGTELRRGSL